MRCYDLRSYDGFGIWREVMIVLDIDFGDRWKRADGIG